MSDDHKISRKNFLKGAGQSLLGLAVGGEMLREQAEAKCQASPPGVVSKAAGKETGPLMLKQTGTLDPGLERLMSVAIDRQDRIYAAGVPGIRVFDRTGKFLRAIKTAGPACCVTVDAEGIVYAGSSDKIEKFDAEGKLLATWGKKGKEPGDFQYITAVAAAGRNVYVADAGARRIHRFANDGDLIEDFPSEGKNFLIPSAYFDCAVDAKGILTVAHTGRHQIERYDETGTLLGAWGKFGSLPEDFCGCCNPTHIALFADGRIATTEKGIPRLKVYSPEGKMLAIVEHEAFPPNVAGLALAVDSKDRIALVEPLGKVIRFYELIYLLKPAGKESADGRQG